MEPLGAAASLITLLGTLIAAVDKAYSVIIGLRDAPRQLQILCQEVLELKAVLIDVKAASELDLQAQQTLSSSQAHRSSTLSHHIKRTQDVISALTDLANDFTMSLHVQQPTVKRVGWLKNRKKIEHLRNDLQNQKMNLALLLMTKMMSHLYSIDRRLAENEAASSSRQNEHLLLLERILQGRAYTTYRLDHDRPAPRTPSQVSPVNAQLAATGIEDGDSQNPSSIPASCFARAHIKSSLVIDESKIVPLNQSAIRRLGRKEDNCRRLGRIICQCSCHRMLHYSTSTISSKAFGRLIIGVSGHIVSDPICDNPTCSDQSRFSMTIAYYFPSWLVAKAIIVNYVRSPYGNPSSGLQVRNLLPEHAPMMCAIMEGQPKTLQSIIEQRISSPNDMEEMGWTPLTSAIHKNQVECCKILLDAGADPTLQDGFGNSAVDFAWLAIFEKQLASETVKFLRESLLLYENEGMEEYNLSSAHRQILGLESGDLEKNLEKTTHAVINSTDSFGKTPLLWASRRGDFRAVRSLLDNGADPNITDSMWRSPLHMATRSKSTLIIKALMESGADPHAANLINELPAHYACYEENSARLVKPFLDAGVNVNQPSKYGRTMLDIAVQWDYPNLVDYLIKSGAKTGGSNPMDWKLKPLGRAVLHKTHGALATLLETRIKTDFVDKNGDNILHFLAKYGDRDVIQDFYHCEHIPIDANCADAKNKNFEQPRDIACTRSDTVFLQAFETFLGFLRHANSTTES